MTEVRAADGARVVTTLRLLPKIRTKLQSAAAANDVSTAQEVERRLEQSFRDEATAGGAERAALTRLIGAVITASERRQGKSFFDDHETALAVRAALNVVLDEVMPLLEGSLLQKHANLFATCDFDAEREIRSRAKAGQTLLDPDKLAIRMRHRRNMEREVIILEESLRDAVSYGIETARGVLDSSDGGVDG